MNLIIDVGNTRVKSAVFENDMIVEVCVFDTEYFLSEIRKKIKKYHIAQAILSNVAAISNETIEKLRKIIAVIELTAHTSVPFTNLYETPKTLGVDRIALAAAAISLYPKKNVLVIDAGTCITFDFVTAKKEYLGGAISPGIQMRFEALHHFTANLPLLDKRELESFIGANTKKSMNSGVVNGIINEIEGVIHQYTKKYTDLTVVLTGGDTNFLAKQLKSSIFANQNFLLNGLNEILIFNKNL